MLKGKDYTKALIPGDEDHCSYLKSYLTQTTVHWISGYKCNSECQTVKTGLKKIPSSSFPATSGFIEIQQKISCLHLQYIIQ